jgi:hypothetical protein|nr:MAG TPA: hypothetical protein [Bacteriophage sp.]
MEGQMDLFNQPDMHIVNARGEFQISFEDIPEVMP